MTRKYCSLAGLLVATFCFSFGSGDAEARNGGGRQRNRCCQQSGNFGFQQSGYSNFRGNGNDGSGYVQMSNYGGQSTSNTGVQQTSCCTPQSGSGMVQPAYGTSAPADNFTPATGNATPPAVPAQNIAPTPGT